MVSLQYIFLVFLAVINALSVDWATRVQDVFSFSKVLALGIIIIGGVVKMGQGKENTLTNLLYSCS